MEWLSGSSGDIMSSNGDTVDAGDKRTIQQYSPSPTHNAGVCLIKGKMISITDILFVNRTFKCKNVCSIIKDNFQSQSVIKLLVYVETKLKEV